MRIDFGIVLSGPGPERVRDQKNETLAEPGLDEMKFYRDRD